MMFLDGFQNPLGVVFGFVPLPPLFLGPMGLIMPSYVASVELAKRCFCIAA
jgi:P-type Mg2+ transporter